VKCRIFLESDWQYYVIYEEEYRKLHMQCPSYVETNMILVEVLCQCTKGTRVDSMIKFSLYRPWRHLGLREVEALTFWDIWLIDGGKVVSSASRPLVTPGIFLALISVRGGVDPRAIVRLAELDKLEKSTSSGTLTGDLLACSIVPQQTTLPRAQDSTIGIRNNNWKMTAYIVRKFFKYMKYDHSYYTRICLL
jgi:hypothetical protein